MANTHYVYGYFHPDLFLDNPYYDFTIKNVPIYIGKGSKNRHLQHLYKSHNEFVNLAIKKLEEQNKFPIIKKLYTNLNEVDAFDLETDIIDHYGVIFEDGVLFNKLIPSKRIVYSTRNFIDEKLNNMFNFYYSVVFNTFSKEKIPNLKVLNLEETLNNMKIDLDVLIEYKQKIENKKLIDTECDNIEIKQNNKIISKEDCMFQFFIKNNENIKERLITNIKIHGISIEEMSKLMKCSYKTIEKIINS
jgi:hypothetical protein